MSEIQRHATYTSLVQECLKERNDFMSYSEIFDYVKKTRSEVKLANISAACFHLKKHKVIDFVIDCDGEVFWFFTPETDDRLRTINERVQESRPRKRRMGRRRFRVTIVSDDGGEP